jgi:purine-cytosine permease-like protein
MRFGMDPKSGKLVLGSWEIAMPRSRIGRIAIGTGLITGGTLGFLPILGFWMLPLGVIVLSHDLHFVRRRRRRMAIWWQRRRQRRNG